MFSWHIKVTHISIYTILYILIPNKYAEPVHRNSLAYSLALLLCLLILHMHAVINCGYITNIWETYSTMTLSAPALKVQRSTNCQTQLIFGYLRVTMEKKKYHDESVNYICAGSDSRLVDLLSVHLKCLMSHY